MSSTDICPTAVKSLACAQPTLTKQTGHLELSLSGAQPHTHSLFQSSASDVVDPRLETEGGPLIPVQPHDGVKSFAVRPRGVAFVALFLGRDRILLQVLFLLLDICSRDLGSYLRLTRADPA